VLPVAGMKTGSSSARLPFVLHLCLASALAAGTPACGDDATDVDAPEAAVDGPETIAFDDYKADAPPTPTTVLATSLGNSTGQGAVLELVVTDVWGRLPDRSSRVRLTREADGKTLTLNGYLEPLMIRLAAPGKYRLEAEMPEHESEKMIFEVRRDARGAFTLPQPADQVTHWGFSSEPRRVGASTETVNSLYLGLPHRLFAASGPPPRRGNEITVFDNGRDTFTAMAGDFEAAERSLSLSLWLMKGDFELRRSEDWRRTTAADRRRESIVEYLRRMKGTRRVLLSQFNGREEGPIPGLVDEAILDDSVQAFGERAGDGVELMLQANETEVPYRAEVPVNAGGWSYRARLLDKYPEWAGRRFTNQENFKVGKYDRTVKWTDVQVASWHQKFAVVDDEIAWLGGMNMNYPDWDRPELAVHDPLRAEPDTDADTRAEIEAGLEASAIAPRKDYMARIEGPLVNDVQTLFQRRWAQGRAEKAMYHGQTTDFTVPPVVDDPDPRNEGVQAQLTVTLPMPFWEHSILESHQRAIAVADDYIYIEDQYFRAPMINAMILDRMAVDPDLKLIVVTKDVPYKDPGRKWTAISLQSFQERFPDRVVFLTLRASAVRETDEGYAATFVGVDIHSKMFIVDDELMSVGSCNKNNRGLIYEGEANLFIRDAFLVSETRRHEWARLVGPDYAEQVADPEIAFEVFRNLAERNDALQRLWEENDGELTAAQVADPETFTPVGLVYPLVVPMEWWFDPGPDFF
jgi:phosphatidylserine/phosphatidylglycerophosphate/cardiolipin synthase-like enzyme